MEFTQEAWDDLMAKYPPGTPVGGVVASRRVFGVFVRLDELPDVPALLEIIHFGVIETDPRHRIEFPADYPPVGARIEARILGWCLRPKDVRLTQLSHLDWSHRRWLAHQTAQHCDPADPPGRREHSIGSVRSDTIHRGGVFDRSRTTTMSWKTIKSNNYYYRNYKIANKVCAFYFGRGPLAEAIARLDARERERRAESRTYRERLATIERQIVECCEGVDELFAAWMRLVGWHKHKGQWRKTGPITRRSMRPSKDLNRLVEAEKVRREFEAGNTARLIELYGGDMARETIERIIASKTDDLREREALRRQAAMIRDRHAGKNPTDIELALAERIAVAYMDVYYADQLAYSVDDDEIEGGVTFREAEYRERRRDRADRRYRAALDQLDRVRKSGASTGQQPVKQFGLVG